MNGPRNHGVLQDWRNSDIILRITMSAEEKRLRQERARRWSSIKWWIFWLLSLSLIVTALYFGREKEDPTNPLVSRDGVHYHAHLSIMIDGKEADVPSGIGLLAGMEHPHQMHTHDHDGIIHVEFPGRVHKKDLALGDFFKVWGKDFTPTSILGNVATGTKKVLMTVNSKEVTDYGDYTISDKDDIKIVYQ